MVGIPFVHGGEDVKLCKAFRAEGLIKHIGLSKAHAIIKPHTGPNTARGLFTGNGLCRNEERLSRACRWAQSEIHRSECGAVELEAIFSPLANRA